MQAVTDRERGSKDLFYLIAKAIEGETFQFSIAHIYGAPMAVDWQAVEQRVRARLAKLSDRPMAIMAGQALPMLRNELALMRPLWVNSVGIWR